MVHRAGGKDLSARFRGELSTTTAGKALCVSSCLGALNQHLDVFSPTHSTHQSVAPFDTGCSKQRGPWHVTVFMPHLHNHSKAKSNQTLTKK